MDCHRWVFNTKLIYRVIEDGFLVVFFGGGGVGRVLIEGMHLFKTEQQSLTFTLCHHQFLDTLSTRASKVKLLKQQCVVHSFD